MQAQLCIEDGAPRAALELIEDLLDGGAGDGAAAEVRAGRAVLHTLAGDCRLAMGDAEGAARAARAARAADPGFAGAASLERRIAGWQACRMPGGRRISAALIAKNAAEDLARCLASLAGAVDEIVVVDTGSTDGTQGIARSAGARVIDFAWRDDFAAARNAALDASTGDWILVIDADETLAPDAGEALARCVLERRVDAARLVIESDTETTDPLAQHRERSIRFFRNLPGVRYTRPVHEQIEPALAAVGARVGDPEALIRHHGYADPAAARRRRRRSLRIMRRELAARHGAPDGILAFHLGLTLAGEGHRDEAIAALEMAVEPARRLAPRLVAHAHARLAQLELDGGVLASARRHLEESLAAAPGDVFARYVAAGLCFAEGDAGGAARALAELLDTCPGGLLRRGAVLLDLGDALLVAGDTDGARRAFVEAAGELPGDERAARRLWKMTQKLEFSR